MFDRCGARITLPWNDNVLSTDHIGFAGERKQSRKQCNFAQKKHNSFCLKIHHFLKSRITNIEIDFLLYCIGCVVPIMRIYASKYTHVIRLDAFCLFFFFFCIYTEKDIKHNWTKSFYIGLHSNHGSATFLSRWPYPDPERLQWVTAIPADQN